MWRVIAFHHLDLMARRDLLIKRSFDPSIWFGRDTTIHRLSKGQLNTNKDDQIVDLGQGKYKMDLGNYYNAILFYWSVIELSIGTQLSLLPQN